MNRLCSINNNFPYDNNLLVLDMVLSSLWASQQPISWENVAKLVPGFTAKECAQRFEELKTTGSFPHVDEQCNLQIGAVGSPSEPFTSYIKSNSLDIAREKRDTQSNPGTPSDSGRTGISSGQEIMAKCTSADSAVKFDGTEGNKNPNMVIHVCDEAKNLKQDFVCRRNLLVKGMRYFEEYLSVDPQRWDEVDISVHCDIQIFDWLMNYVKSSEQPEKHAEKPRLEHSNVISILISSEFLKMDALVEECVQYCHQHMNAIIATPCNMNCINNNLAGCIADLFSHNEADDLKDKKDKFKSKLFQKKIERLFDADYQNHDSPGSASTLYRCGLCLKLLTKDTERKIPCIPNKINIDIRGNILFTHSRQKTWEVHEYLHGLYEELKSWVLVYWRIWGTVNFLTCSRCKQAFLCTELGQCKYHPDPAVYPGMGAGRGVGIHPCCNQKVLRFDPYSTPKGCQIRDHDVSSTDAGDRDGNCSKVVNDLLLHRDSVLSSAEHPSGTEDVPEADVMLKPGTLTAHKHRELSAFSLLKNWSLQLHQRSLLSEDEEYTTGSEVTEDEVGDEDDTSKKQAAKKARKPGKPLKRQVSSPNFHRKEKRREKAPSRDSTPFTVSIQKNKWDSNRSLRFNQDAQREEDQRRMEEIIANLTKMRFGDQEHTKIRDTKEPAGGLYSKLEAQLRVSSQSSGRHNSSEKTTRAKIRSGPSRPT